MYNKLNKKCETMIEELMTVKADCLVDGTSMIKDFRAGNMLDAINRATNALTGVMDIIKAYYSED